MNDMNGKHGIVCIGLLMMLSSCHTSKQITASGLQRKDFQTEVNGQHTDLFTLSNKKGMEVRITNYWGEGGFHPCTRQKWKTGGCGVRISHDW